MIPWTGFWCLLFLDAERPRSLLTFPTTKISQVQLFDILTWNCIIYCILVASKVFCFHLAEKFNHIFYSVVSSTPNFRVIVQRILEHNGHQAPTFDNDTQAANAFIDLIEELDGPIYCWCWMMCGMVRMICLSISGSSYQVIRFW